MLQYSKCAVCVKFSICQGHYHYSLQYVCAVARSANCKLCLLYLCLYKCVAKGILCLITYCKSCPGTLNLCTFSVYSLASSKKCFSDFFNTPCIQRECTVCGPQAIHRSHSRHEKVDCRSLNYFHLHTNL